MKPPVRVLAGSLAANVALFATLVLRPALAPPAFRDFFSFHFFALANTAPAAKPATRPTPRVAATTAPLSWASLQTDDLRALIARLRAAGFPPEIIRAIVSAEVGARYDARIAAARQLDPDTPFWKRRPVLANSKEVEEANQLSRERAKLLRDLFSDPFFGNNTDVTAAQRRQYGNLTSVQIDALRRIEDDYADMNSQLRAGMNGIALPADRDALALLDRERRADLATVLSPDQVSDYLVRSSQITSLLRSQLGTFDPTENEFRAIFQAEQTFSDAVMLGGGMQALPADQRTAAQQQLAAQIKAGLGDERYSDLTRDTSSDFQRLNQLAQSNNLPADAALQAYGLRNNVAQQSNLIYDNAALSLDDKRATLQSLADATRSQLLATLGPVAGPAYLKTADQWLNNVARGAAVTFGGSVGGVMISNTSAVVSLGGDGASYRRLPSPPPPR